MTAEIHLLHGDRPPSLDPMMALVAADMNEVNAVILDRMQSEVPLIPELAGHLIAGGGKRMRPMLTLACGKLLDYPGHRHCNLAAAVEFIHTATLLHDDVVDGSDLRRGRKTANIIWGNSASVLVGDFLFSRAFEVDRPAGYETGEPYGPIRREFGRARCGAGPTHRASSGASPGTMPERQRPLRP